MTHQTMHPGSVLPNGAVVIAASARNAHEWIVLALSTNTASPYITWKAGRPGNGTDLTAGRYFDSIADAVTDYKSRP